MSHGSRDHFYEHILGEEGHTAKKPQYQIEKNPVEWFRESFNEHDLQQSFPLAIKRVCQGVLGTLAFYSYSWALGHQGQSRFSIKMMEQKANGDYLKMLKYMLHAPKPFAVAGVGSGLVLHTFHDFTDFDQYTKNLICGTIIGVANGIAFKRQGLGPGSLTFLLVGAAAMHEFVRVRSTNDESGLRIADKDRTPEEAYRARVDKMLYDISYDSTPNLRSQYFERL